MIRKYLLAALLCIPAVAHADWHVASSAHFVVYSDQRPEDLQEFASELERFDKAVRVRFGQKEEVIAAPQRVTIYVVRSTDAVARLAGSRFVAGFYSARAGGSLAVVPRLSGDGMVTDLKPQEILLHEYAHHFMWSMMPHAVFPTWFVEGFAESLATARFEKDGSVTLGAPPHYRSHGLFSETALRVDRVLGADTLKLNDAERDSLYGMGWLLTHYLTYGGKRSGQLAAYIRAINAGKSASDAAELFGDLRILDRELDRYKSTRFSAVRVAAAALKIGPVTVRKLSAGEAVTMQVRIRSDAGVNARTAPGVYADAKKAAAPFPSDAAAQLMLAEAAYDAGDFPAAEAAADRAIVADPKATGAYLYKARALMAVAEEAKDRSKESWSAIRKIIAAANRVEPDDPRPLILYYRSFGMAGVEPPETAKQGLARAFELAPYDTGVRLLAAAMYLKLGNVAVGRDLLAPLAYQPHGRGVAKVANTAIAKIDAGDVPGAINAIENLPAPDAADGDSGAA